MYPNTSLALNCLKLLLAYRIASGEPHCQKKDNLKQRRKINLFGWICDAFYFEKWCLEASVRASWMLPLTDTYRLLPLKNVFISCGKFMFYFLHWNKSCILLSCPSFLSSNETETNRFELDNRRKLLSNLDCTIWHCTYYMTLH